MTDLKYPIGKFKLDPDDNGANREKWISQIEQLPHDLRELVRSWDDEQLSTRYRPDGWTARQVVHHLADSHLNGYVRFRWGLTEENPTIKTYNQDLWAALRDAEAAPIESSLSILEGVHARWTFLLKSLSQESFNCKTHHPEWGEIGLTVYLQLYAWHGRHHLAHLQGLAERKGW
jgi:hypothetical protein